MTLHHQLGVLFVGHDGPDDFSREHQLILSTIAEQAAVGLENLRLYRQSQEHARVTS